MFNFAPHFVMNKLSWQTTEKSMDVHGHCSPLIWTAAHYWCPWTLQPIDMNCSPLLMSMDTAAHWYELQPIIDVHGHCSPLIWTAAHYWCPWTLQPIDMNCSPLLMSMDTAAHWYELQPIIDVHGHIIQVFWIMSNIYGMQFIKMNLWENVYMKFKFLILFYLLDYSNKYHKVWIYS